MSRVSEFSIVQWPQIHSFMRRLDRLRTRNAFSDARRAQAARLLAQQAGPSLGRYSHDTKIERAKKRSSVSSGYRPTFM
jgi:hypothetical protein